MRHGRHLLLLLIIVGSGCRSNDAVERQLHARDIQYREALEELNRTEAIANNLRRENQVLRGGQNLSPELAAQTFGVRRITLGRGTSATDQDGLPGDEMLHVWLEPRDEADHTIKAPGVAQICVLEINSQGNKTPLWAWDVDEAKLRQSWKQGLLSIGYHLQFSWKVPPRTENIRVIARFKLPDGRVFETDRDLRVKLMPGASSRPDPSPSDVPVFMPLSNTGPVQPVGRWTSHSSDHPAVKWQGPPLHEAVTLGRPLGQIAPPAPELPLNLMSLVGEIKVDD